MLGFTPISDAIVSPVRGLVPESWPQRRQKDDDIIDGLISQRKAAQPAVHLAELRHVQ